MRKSGTSRLVKTVPSAPPPASRAPMCKSYLPGGTSNVEMTRNPVPTRTDRLSGRMRMFASKCSPPRIVACASMALTVTSSVSSIQPFFSVNVNPAPSTVIATATVAFDAAPLNEAALAWSVRPLVWIGAPGGQAWKRRPLPLGTVAGCIFNKAAIECLNAAGFDWTVTVDSASNPVMDANLAADRVVRLQMQGSVNLQVEEIRHGGALPRLPDFYVNMYLTQGPRRRLAEPLAEALRGAYAESRFMVAAE